MLWIGPINLFCVFQLAEIIGFDRLELVQLLLQHRTAIVVSFMGDNESPENGPQSKQFVSFHILLYIFYTS